MKTNNTWNNEDIYKCVKCGLKRTLGTREATRDFVFANICIKCNRLEAKKTLA